jgi:hypothetical protein
MKIRETLRKATDKALRFAFSSYFEERFYAPRGDVFIVLRDGKTGEVQEKREIRNLVVKDASILIARLLKNSQEPPHGAFCLAVGSGDVGWDLMNPPAPTDTQRSLYSEIARKTFASTTFVDAGGLPVAYPTNIVDYTTTFTESEAVGPLVEMALLGGNIVIAPRNPVTPPNGTYDPTVDLTTKETQINSLSFAVINKPATSTLSIVWRITT